MAPSATDVRRSTGTTTDGGSSATASVRPTREAVELVVAGDWSLTEAPPQFADVRGALQRQLRGHSRLHVDGTELGVWDSSLLMFLEQAHAFAADEKLTVDLSGLPDAVGRLLALAQVVPERAQPPAPTPPSWVTRLGLLVTRAWAEAKTGISFTGEVALSLAGLVTRRVHMRWRDFWMTVQTNSSGALPIVTLIALLVGIIIAFLGVVVLKRFGAGYYVSYLVGFGMLREMGALMTGIIIAGRTGAAFAAELGSMKITEEIDAFTTLGISPIDHLVQPRLLGLFVMFPLLTLYADFIGIVGGLSVSAIMLDLSAKQFLNGLLAAVTIGDAVLGIVKGIVFGGIVGIAGCMKGLQAGNDASAVGRAATSAVVLGITCIITANALIDWLAALLDV